MPKTRFLIVAMLAVAVLAAACGGDDATDEPEDDAQTAAVSEVTASVGDQSATTTSETPIPAEAAPEPAPEPVRLADRFSWCSTHQRTWDRLAELQLRADDMEAARLNAQAALDTATDELDIAEAVQAVESAEESYRDFVPTYRDVLRDATRLLDPDWVSNSGDDTEPIAVGRARDAFYATADPTLVELLEAEREGIPRFEPPPFERETVDESLTAGELLAALEALRDEAADAAQEGRDAKLAMQKAFLDLQAAHTPTDVMDAYQRFVDGYLALRELENAASVIRWRAEDEIHPALRAAGGATDASFRWVEDINNARRVVAFIHPWPYIADPNRNETIPARFSDVEWATGEALRQTVNELVLDAPAWRAFQESLSESCQQ